MQGRGQGWWGAVTSPTLKRALAQMHRPGITVTQAQSECNKDGKQLVCGAHTGRFTKTMSHRIARTLPGFYLKKEAAEKSLAQGHTVIVILPCEGAGTQTQDSKSSCSFTTGPPNTPSGHSADQEARRSRSGGHLRVREGEAGRANSQRHLVPGKDHGGLSSF